MKTKGIEKAIDFAIENGFEGSDGSLAYDETDKFFKLGKMGYGIGKSIEVHFYERNSICGTKTSMNSFSVEKLITSKPFIEALARGLEKQGYVNSQSGMSPVDVDELRNSISLAIYNDTLDDYFTNLTK